MTNHGSQQLRIFRRALHLDGRPLEEAAALAGMHLTEARMWADDDAKDPPPPEAFELIGHNNPPKEIPMAEATDDRLRLFEVWLPVAGLVGMYEVSNLGSVRNAQTGQVLRPAIHNGYAHVSLAEAPGRQKTHRVHVLVLKTFCGARPFPGAEACHNDGNRVNNRLTNLRWGTRQDNTDDRTRHGRTRFGTGQRCAKLDEHKVRKMRADFRAGKSTRQLARDLNLSTHTAWCAVVGKTWRHVEGAVSNG